MRQYLELIYTGGQDAAAVVRRLREFYRSRIDGAAGDGPDGESFQPVAVNPLVKQTIDLTRPRWQSQAQASGQAITVETALESVPLVWGDEAALREALVNLIFNAVDAMPGGGTITVRTRLQDGQVVAAVSDTGVGMSEEVRRRCFEPLYTTKGDQGTGLGLALVKGVIERHGGTIAIDSSPGAGTTVSLHLPVADESPTEEADTEPAGPARPLHVLVVDDEPGARDVTAAYLRNDGHLVVTAASGREGLERISASPFDLVITDRAMPDMNGDQLALAVKAASPRTPVVMVSGYGDLMVAAGELPAGIDAIVGKPVTAAALRRALSAVLGG